MAHPQPNTCVCTFLQKKSYVFVTITTTKKNYSGGRNHLTELGFTAASVQRSTVNQFFIEAVTAPASVNKNKNKKQKPNGEPASEPAGVPTPRATDARIWYHPAPRATDTRIRPPRRRSTEERRRPFAIAAASAHLARGSGHHGRIRPPRSRSRPPRADPATSLEDPATTGGSGRLAHGSGLYGRRCAWRSRMPRHAARLEEPPTPPCRPPEGAACAAVPHIGRSRPRSLKARR